jgi:hypothetical protein
MQQTEVQETTQYSTINLSQNTTFAFDDTQFSGQLLDGTVKTFLRGIASNSTRVDMLCYFTRLATTGNAKSYDSWKALCPIANIGFAGRHRSCTLIGR